MDMASTSSSTSKRVAEVITLSSSDDEQDSYYDKLAQDVVNINYGNYLQNDLHDDTAELLDLDPESEPKLPEAEPEPEEREPESYRVRLPKKNANATNSTESKKKSKKVVVNKSLAIKMSHVQAFHEAKLKSTSETVEDLLEIEQQLKKVAAAAAGTQRDKELRKVTDKQQEKERKNQAKAEAQRQREAKKVAEQREKDLKKAENEIRKNSKPGEAVRFMTVLLDPNVTKKEAIEAALDTNEIKYAVSVNLPIANSFLFERESVYQAMGDDLKLHKLSKFEREKQILILLEPNSIVPKIIAQLPTSESLGTNNYDDEEDNIDIITWVMSIKSSLLPGKDVTLILYGMEDYFKKVKRTEHQDFRDRVLNGGGDKPRRKRKETLPVITKFDFQSCLIEMQLKTGINYRIVNNAQELGLLIVQYTKAIADAPFKIAQRERSSFDWYALADTSGSVKVEKDGNGLSLLWIDQLQQFNKVGIDIAKAIAKKYPTPQILIEAYDNCSTQEEGHSLLTNLEVITGFGPLQRRRKLGPELSRKLFRFFTSTNSERCLGSSQSF